MERRQEIDQSIEDLKKKLEMVEGSPTEIYTRIVGYYRSLKNWNKGKREEYNHRVTFKPDARTKTPGRAAQAFAEAAIEAAAAPAPPVAKELDRRRPEGRSRTQYNGIQSYTYYYRQSCPKCPPVRSYMESIDLEGRMVDVDTGQGMADAIEHQILSTPTVLLMNDDGETVAQAGSVTQLRLILETAQATAS